MAAATALSFCPARAGAVVVLVVAVLLAAGSVHGEGGAGGGGGRGARTALDDVCSDLGGYYVTPEICASALCGDPSSRCRAARGAPEVAVLAARLAVANATATKASIEAALALAGGGTEASASSSSSSPTASRADARRKGMRSCLKLYAGAVPALQWAAQSVAAGRYRGAREVLQAAQYVALGCEGMAGGEAALPRENDQFSLMAIVAHAVVASMLGP
ncbi:hypothetical protein GUJ93_ZPchr0012g19135 [Zizania palustris]|uniref:Pectinesterase inhibitor domain-containing protein n=1 Tax=Zizania palustris TaxID=103762 RepID=A0A8J5WRQ6_ZIZPA|nr:hypothetical protein GUJ93_ZPchr0012g19135 [Zizania palustris]